MKCPTCGRTQLSEWPHDHLTRTPDRRSCSVMAWLLLSWAIAALLLIAVVSCIATPSSAVHVGAARLAVAPSEGRGIATEHDRLSPAPHSPGGTHSAGVRGQSADVWYPRPTGIPGGAPLPVVASAASESPDASSSGLASVPAPRTGTPADFTSQGSIAWAAPRYGPLYLALPEPRGTVAIVCGPAGCVTRTSTDFGPDQRTYPDRIADVSAADFPVICGVPLSFGRCPGSVTILSRPHLPETDLDVR